jgi:DNA-binding IclR family transcriptional regulator
MHNSIVEKLVALLGLISEAETPMALTERVTKSGINKSTIHRLLATDLEQDRMQLNKDRKEYLLGSKGLQGLRHLVGRTLGNDPSTQPA